MREALFSSLGDLTDASVLDLYAGSGALGIEALSRGASGAVLVDEDRAAVDAIDANLAATRLGDRARIGKASVSTFLRRRVPSEAPFDVVFADPPYGTDQDVIIDLLEALASPGWLSEGARVVVERAARDPFSSPGSPWSVGWERTYGDTLVVVFRASG